MVAEGQRRLGEGEVSGDEGSGALSTAMAEIAATRQTDQEPARHWYSGPGRTLFAQERDGRWFHLEYSFRIDKRLFELRWTEGRPARLWSSPWLPREVDEESWLAHSRLLEVVFPEEEIRRLGPVMRDVPHSLWARLIKLALDAHFVDHPFPLRRHERRHEKRGSERRNPP